MDRKRTQLISALALVLTLIASGCATKISRNYGIVFPPPPDEPKLVLTGIYATDIDLRDEITFLEKLLGLNAAMSFARPYGVCVQGDRMYVADSNGGTVYIFDFKAKKVFGITGSANVVLRMPMGVAVSADGTVYISDALEGKVFAFDAKGNYLTQIGATAGLKRPAGLAIDDGLGRLYVADVLAHSVFVFSLPDMNPLMTIGKQGGGNGDFYNPTNIAVDRRDGNLAVVDTSNFRVQLFDKEGVFLSKFGQVGDAPGDFGRPKGVGIDSDGHIYVADATYNNFQVFDDKGKLYAVVGRLGNQPGTFQLPAGMFVDDQDRVYIVDGGNLRVQVFQYFSEAWKMSHPDEYAKYAKQKK